MAGLLSIPERLLPDCDVAKLPPALRMQCRQPAGDRRWQEGRGSWSNLTWACRL